jgi:hypothetical protein
MMEVGMRLGMVMVLGLAGAAIAEDAPGPLDRLIGKDADRFVSRMTDLIAGYGGPDGLTAQGIEEHIALERAGARATALRRMLAMDLDADGTLTRAELQVSQRAASASTRGRMEQQFLAADADGDGRIDQGEMAAAGRAAALRALDEDEAEALRALMTLDRDGNAALTAEEVAAASALAEDAT